MKENQMVLSGELTFEENKKEELPQKGRYRVVGITTFFMGKSAVTLSHGTEFQLEINRRDEVWLQFGNGIEILLDPSNVQKSGFHVERIS